MNKRKIHKYVMKFGTIFGLITTTIFGILLYLMYITPIDKVIESYGEFSYTLLMLILSLFMLSSSTFSILTSVAGELTELKYKVEENG